MKINGQFVAIRVKEKSSPLIAQSSLKKVRLLREDIQKHHLFRIQ